MGKVTIVGTFEQNIISGKIDSSLRFFSEVYLGIFFWYLLMKSSNIILLSSNIRDLSEKNLRLAEDFNLWMHHVILRLIMHRSST